MNSITTSVQFTFDDSRLRDYSYHSYLPELKTFRTDRSSVKMSKKGDSNLEFIIESKDITAFRASMNDIISLGKVIEGISFLRENYT